MEKLIELLDFYRRENKTEELFGEPGTLVPLTGKDFIMLNRVMIISKEYGFIKRLVEKDKINFNGLPNIFTSIYAEKRDDIYYEIEHNNYSVLTEQYGVEHTNRLLMLLSISSSPIEDLISYLR